MSEEKDLGEHICSAAVEGDRSAEATTPASHVAPKHTPGPWYWSSSGLIQTSHLTRDVWEIPRNEADQHLIAAAPEMYEALKYALNCFDRESCDPMVTLDPVQAIALMKYAIAKAEGRQP